GIRGVGKTTLLSQLYFFEKFPSATRGGSDVPADALDERFYISADRLVSDGISLQDFVRYLESVVWGDLTKNEKKILLLIDEIQYDDRWDLFLKLLFDKTKGNDNILVVATGSSAIFLNQKNKDLVRRSKSERVLPEKFTEYLSLHRGFSPPEELSAALREAFFAAADAREVFEKIHSLRSEAVSFLSSVKDLSQAEEDYFLRGSFPFSAEMTSVSQALERIKNMILVNIIQRDLVLSGNFDAETLVKIPDILFLLANSDEVSTGNLANTLKLHSNTVNKILKSLVDAEILYEINPYGQPYKRIRKSAKYLFVGPAVRSGLLSGVFAADIKGKLPEDCAALIFTTDLYEKANVFYDYGKGGADFILRFSDNSEVVLEIGLGKGEITQVEKTLKKTAGRARYGLVIGAQELELVGEKIVKIPLEYFLLA
ncbi:MAG TPA: ATP-binding protein, partial [Candidatus Moranbacteria bacterium]|nr:ATP-binding protein [Candidatus Moranbacteria bacterium]